MKTKKITCDDCNVLVINNKICHEFGCPSAWRDMKYNCKWCGQEFTPEEKGQEFCEDSCYCAYAGIEYK